MKNYLITLIFAFAVWSIASAQDITGSWNGKLVLPNGSLNIVFNITQTGNGYSATMDSPDQGVKGIPTESTMFKDSMLTVKIPGIQASYKGKLQPNNCIKGTFTQGIKLPLELRRGEPDKPKRPQEPKAPFHYRTEDVTFHNAKAGIDLAGTLTLPQTGKSFPVAVLITGSGAQNRDEEIMGHKPFLVIADYLTRNGIAVLRFDDRGTGESKGDYSQATNANFADDAEAALDYLKGRKEIDPKQMGVIGHSCGGTSAFILGAVNKEVAFIISLAGAAVKGEQLMLRQAELVSKSNGMTNEMWKVSEPVLRNRYAILAQQKEAKLIKEELYADALKHTPASQLSNVKQQMDAEINAMTSPWYLDFIQYDPGQALKKIKCPVLALNGDKDIQVDADMNLNAIESLTKENGNKQVTIKKYPDLNHLFQSCKTCTISEYGQLEETISPQVLQDMTEWIKNIK